IQQSLGVIDSKLSSILPFDLGLGTTLATDFLQFQKGEGIFEFGRCAILNLGTTDLTVRIALWTSRQVLGAEDIRIAPNDLVEKDDFTFTEGGCNSPKRCWCTFTFAGPANAVRAHFEKFSVTAGGDGEATSVAREVAR